MLSEKEKFTNNKVIEDKIKSITEKPIYTKFVRYPQIIEQEICRRVNDMIEDGILGKTTLPITIPYW